MSEEGEGEGAGEGRKREEDERGCGDGQERRGERELQRGVKSNFIYNLQKTREDIQLGCCAKLVTADWLLQCGCTPVTASYLHSPL